MGVIFKREWKEYIHSLRTYICMALILAVCGLMLVVENLIEGSPNFEYTLLGGEITLILLVLVAGPCMGAERRAGMDRFYRSLPLSATEVVIGKYMALLCVWAVPCAILAVYPPILGLYGAVNYVGAYTSLLCFFLLGAALLAVCQFISSLFDYTWIPAAVGALALVMLYFLPDVRGWFPTSPLASYLAFLVLSLLLAIAAWAVTRHLTVAAVSGAVLVLPLSILYLVKGEWFAGAFATVAAEASPFLHFENVTTLGILSLTDIVALLSFAGLFVFLAILSAERSVRRSRVREDADSDLDEEPAESAVEAAEKGGV